MENIFEGVEIAEEIKSQLSERFDNAINEANKQAVINANKILDSVGNVFANEYKIERLASETKITDYLKRASNQLGLNSLKASEKHLKEKDEAIKELKAKIEAGVTDDSFKAEHEALKTKYSKLYSEFETKTKEIEELEQGYNTKLQSYKIDHAINSSLPEFAAGVNKFELDYKIKEAKDKIKNDFVLKLNDSNELIAEHKESYQNKKAKDLLSELLKDYLPTKKTNGGGATPPENNKELKINPDMSKTEKLEIAKSFVKAKGVPEFENGAPNPKFAAEIQEILKEQ